MSLNSELARHLDFIYELYKSGKPTLNRIGNCYGQLIDSYKSGSISGIVNANKSVYNYLFNKDIIAYVTYANNCGIMSNIVKKYPNITELLDINSDFYITKIAREIPSLEIPSLIESVEELSLVLDTFGLAIATDDDYDADDTPNLDNRTMEILNNSVFDDDTELEAYAYDESDDTDRTDDKTTDLDIEDEDELDSYDDSSDSEQQEQGEQEQQEQGEQEQQEQGEQEQGEQEQQEQGEQEQQEQGEQQEVSSSNDSESSDSIFDKDYSDLKRVWGTQLNNIVNSIMDSYKDLYEAGYALISPVGILTNVGIIRSTTDSNQVKTTGDAVTDIKLYNKILELTGDQYTYFSQHNDDFDINLAMSMKQPLILTDFHIRNIFGHLNFCTGKYSLRKYITKHNIDNKSTTKMVKYSDMKGYIRQCVEDIFYESYTKLGITDQISKEAIDTVENINLVISRCLKNVIVVAERKQNINTRLKICSDRELNIEYIKSELTKSLNIGTSSGVSIKSMGEPRNGVYDINIVYNEKSYSQDALFAYQVLDILKEQNIRPSWDNVILGKKDNGNIMTYNFKSTQNPIYGLYAGSRSGKGVMTLNLLASAMADGCKIFYVDGKPEMSCVLADLAWKSGVDTFAFNGLDVNGNFGLENRGNSIRTIDRFYSRSDIPDNIFKTEDDINTFMMTVHYLRGLEVTIKMAKERMDKCSPDDWIVAVFDECEQFAAQESLINSLMDKAYEKRKKAIDPNDPKGTKKINITKDPAAIFIDNYREWTERLQSEFTTCVKSAFGKGNMTVFFVWQSSKFPNNFVRTSTLASMVESTRSKMIKILGKGAVEQGGSTDFGNATTLKDMKWYDERFSGKQGGYFAIGNKITGNMTVFRPFNVYSDANNKDLILTNAKDAGLTEQDLYGVSLNPDGTVIQEIGFEGYVTKLLQRFNITPAQQLNLGFNYADNAVKSLGLAGSLLEFVYNASDFMGDKKLEVTADTSSNEGFTLDPNVPLSVGGDTNTTDISSDSTESIDLNGGDEINFGSSNESEQSNYNRDLTQQELDIIQRAREINKNNTPSADDNKSSNVVNRPIINNGPIDGSTDLGDYRSKGWESGNLEYDEEQSDEWRTINDSRNMVSPSPEEINNGTAPVFEDGTGRDLGVTFFTASKTANILNLNSSNSCIVTASDHRSPSKSENLMRFLQGTRYELKSRWKSILDAIARKQNPITITNVTLFNDALIFNKRQIAAIGLIGGPDGVEVRDIVNFGILAKRFKNIREMKIDTEIYNSAYLELGDYPETGIFNLFPSLLRLTVWMPGYSDPPVVYDRQTINSENAHARMEEINAKNKLKQHMDVMAASYNPRFTGLTPVQKTRIINGSKGLTSAGWNKCKQSFSKDHYLRGTLAGVFTIGAGIVSLGISSAFKLNDMFKRR